MHWGMQTDRTNRHPAHPSRIADTAEILHGERVRDPLPEVMQAADIRYFEKPRVATKRPRIRKKLPVYVFNK